MLSGSGWDATRWLAAATFGVYLLVIVGATASLADAAEACSSWPVCSGALGDPVVLVALSHHVMAAVVGLVLLVAAVTVVRTETPRRVRGAVALAVALYPVQIGVGAYLATAGSVLPGLHLLAGLLIFGTLVVALAWQLEHETGDPDESPDFDPGIDDAPDPPESPETPDTPGTPLADRSLATRLRARGFAYFRLMKPRLMWLLSLVAAAAMALAATAGYGLSVGTIVLTLGGGVLAIGASGTFNHVLERDRDRRMSRTNDRPIARHQVPARNAIAFGLALTALSLVLFLQLNALTGALGLTAIIFYSVIYTLVLKPNTVQNTVIGGAAGSLPALIGWAGVTGRIEVAGLMLATVIFVWTPAHFYNLALAYREDYERGGFPMMPVVRGETETRKHVLLWLGTTLAATAALIWLTPLAWLTAIVATAVGTVFLWAVVRLHREQTDQAAFRAFHASNAYLGLVLVAIVVESLAF
jgi:protoheme IX farnesyltransferase